MSTLIVLVPKKERSTTHRRGILTEGNKLVIRKEFTGILFVFLCFVSQGDNLFGF